MQLQYSQAIRSLCKYFHHLTKLINLLSGSFFPSSLNLQKKIVFKVRRQASELKSKKKKSIIIYLFLC